MSLIHDRNGQFVCVGIRIRPDTLALPFVDLPKEGGIWFQGHPLLPSACIKRSPRHYYMIYKHVEKKRKQKKKKPEEGEEEEEDELYTKHCTDIHATKQICTVESPTFLFETAVDGWIWREDGSYRLRLRIQADPRLNGSPVVTKDGLLLGMAISLSWMGFVECIPADLFCGPISSAACFTYYSPALLLSRIDDTTCYHDQYGKIFTSFRELDKHADRGVRFRVSCEDKGNIYMSGGVITPYTPLKYKPFVEWGPFVFNDNVYGEVEKVSEVYVDESVRKDEILLVCPNKVLVKVDQHLVHSLRELIVVLSSDGTCGETRLLHWADGRIQRVFFQPLLFLGGTLLSSYASLWYEEVEGERDVAKDRRGGGEEGEEDARSCTDPCDPLSFL